MRVGGQTILFGGDLGRYGRPVLPDPTPIDAADVLLVESTYGDRLHEANDDGARLAAIVNESVTRGGKLIVPSFAIGRVEEVIYWLKRLEQAKRIPALPVYVDSPMASGALQFYAQRLNELDPDMKPAERDVRVFGTARMTSSPRRRTRPISSRRISRRSSSRPAAWRPAAGCCIIWRRRCPIRGTPCSSSAIRHSAHAAAISATAPSR